LLPFIAAPRLGAGEGHLNSAHIIQEIFIFLSPFPDPDPRASFWKWPDRGRRQL